MRERINESTTPVRQITLMLMKPALNDPD